MKAQVGDKCRSRAYLNGKEVVLATKAVSILGFGYVDSYRDAGDGHPYLNETMDGVVSNPRRWGFVRIEVIG